MPTITPTSYQALRRLRTQLSEQIERSSRGGPMTLAIIVGLVAGLGAVGFEALIEAIDWFFFDIVKDEWLGSLGRSRLMLIPALGALLVGPITLIFAPEARGHGVPEVMLAVETRGGRIRPRVAAAKSLASALTIGSGGSVGKEGPIVQIGSAFGSTMGQILSLSDDNIRLLVASGAAGGIAGTFNAPIAGVFFALEVILRRFSTRNFSVVVLSAVVATVVAVAFRGDEPVIPIPEYQLESAAEIPLYGLLGAICAVVAVVFIRMLYWSEDHFEALPFPPLVLMPVVGGLMVGALALMNDGVLGLGEDAVESALNGETATRTLTLLLFLKLAATSITIGSGGSGGVFRPSLFLGAMVGGAFGSIVPDLLPGTTADSGAYATVGMAAVFAGAARAPITSVLILFEMTRDYGIMLPLMTSVTVATVASQLMSSGTIYSIKLARRGIHLEEDPEPVNLLRALRVSDAMSPVSATIALDARLPEMVRAMHGDQEAATLVLADDGTIVGIVTNYDLNSIIADGGADELTAADICTREIQTVFADQTLHDALAIFAGRGIHSLPVVSRTFDRRPEGILRRSDITRAYSRQVESRDAAQLRRSIGPAARADDVRYLDLRIAPVSAVDGRILAEVALTSDAVVVAVHHAGGTLIPRGNTRLSAGDHVTVITTAEAADRVRALFEGPPRA